MSENKLACSVLGLKVVLLSEMDGPILRWRALGGEHCLGQLQEARASMTRLALLQAKEWSKVSQTFGSSTCVSLR